MLQGAALAYGEIASGVLYIESDPTGLAAGVNTYGYANADPLSFIDPEGLSGSSAQRRGARRAQPPGPVNPSTNDLGPLDGLPDAIKTNICMFTKEGCLDPDLLVCVEWSCTPKCGEPYKIYAGKHSFSSPDTSCTCTKNKINPNYDKPLPGL